MNAYKWAGVPHSGLVLCAITMSWCRYFGICEQQKWSLQWLCFITYIIWYFNIILFLWLCWSLVCGRAKKSVMGSFWNFICCWKLFLDLIRKGESRRNSEVSTESGISLLIFEQCSLTVYVLLKIKVALWGKKKSKYMSNLNQVILQRRRAPPAC